MHYPSPGEEIQTNQKCQSSLDSGPRGVGTALPQHGLGLAGLAGPPSHRPGLAICFHRHIPWHPPAAPGQPGSHF